MDNKNLNELRDIMHDIIYVKIHFKEYIDEFTRILNTIKKYYVHTI